jgi:hypothetical protein
MTDEEADQSEHDRSEQRQAQLPHRLLAPTGQPESSGMLKSCRVGAPHNEIVAISLVLSLPGFLVVAKAREFSRLETGRRACKPHLDQPAVEQAEHDVSRSLDALAARPASTVAFSRLGILDSATSRSE